MRLFPNLLVFAVASTFAACGGATGGPITGTPPQEAGVDAGQDASPVKDSGATGLDAPITDDTCSNDWAHLIGLLAAAQACCAQCASVQCAASVPGPCCDVSVTAAGSAATLSFESALTSYLQTCTPECDALTCTKAPSGACGTSGQCD